MLMFFLGLGAAVPLFVWLVGTISMYVLQIGFPGRISWRGHLLAWGWPVYMAVDWAKHRMGL